LFSTPDTGRAGEGFKARLASDVASWGPAVKKRGISVE